MAKKILVIDDEKDIVEIYRRALIRAGYEPICAYNGQEGLNILRANPVNLIVLDLKMPKMAGDEFLKVVRRDPLLKDNKILVMSSVLYQYKERHRYESDSRYVRTDVVKEGLTKIARRAQETTEPEEGKLEMEEKPKARLEWSPVFGYEAEKEAEFERELSEELIRRIKKIFGEPYEKGKTISRTAIEEKTKDIIAKWFKVEKDKLWPSTSFKKDLGTTFMDDIDLRNRVEKEFKVKISWENQGGIGTIADLAYCLEYLKMQARTKKERFRESDRKFWEEWKPYYIAVAVGILFWLLAIFIWEMIKKIK